MDAITDTTTPLEAISILQKHGCDDITHSLDQERIPAIPATGDEYFNIYQGTLLGGARVAIKSPRFLDRAKNDAKTTRLVAKELSIWSRLKHPNVHELYGITLFQNELSAVSLWMKNGTLPAYISRSPEVNRLQLCVQVSSGLDYLHRNDVVHRGLQGSNILISEAGAPKLYGFENAASKSSTIKFSVDSFHYGISPRWAAPELICGADEIKGSDIYALGMVFLEIVTGNVPFSALKFEIAVINEVLLKKRKPERPKELHLLGEHTADTLWDIMSQCWSFGAINRPDASQVIKGLERILAGRPCDAIVISKRTLGTEIISYLVSNGVADVSDDLNLDHCGERPIAGGGFGDIYQGRLSGAQKVAIKCPRIFAEEDERANEASKNIAREIYAWSKLRHPNVLELIGLATFRGHISIVSPWLDNGTLPKYLKNNPRGDRFQLCLEIASGLAYLHGSGAVHGDVKGLNVLVSQEGSAKLTDFGNTVLKKYTIQFTGKADNSLSLRWSAPELFNGGIQTKATDVYALGMTFSEIITGDVPYRKLPFDPAVIYAIMRGEIPERPKELAMIGEHKGNVLWETAVECWNRKADSRPSASEIERKLSMLEV